MHNTYNILQFKLHITLHEPKKILSSHALHLIPNYLKNHNVPNTNTYTYVHTLISVLNEHEHRQNLSSHQNISKTYTKN